MKPRGERILVVDDDRGVRETMRMILGPGYHYDFARDLFEADRKVRQGRFDLILLDLRMPGGSGIQLLPVLKNLRADSEVIIVTAWGNYSDALLAIEHDVAAFIEKDFSPTLLKAKVEAALERRRRTLTLAAMRSQLDDCAPDLLPRVERMLAGTEPGGGAARGERGEDLEFFRTLANVLDSQDQLTAGHSLRVSRHATAVSRRLGLDDEMVARVELAGYLHDLGKVGVNKSVLNKEGCLETVEWVEIQQHPVLGAEMIEPLGLPADVVDAVRHHHERLDGSGYPDGQRGDDIGPLTRIIAVVDAFDAMTRPRIYRRAPWSALDTIERLRASTGAHLDGGVLEAMVEAIELGLIDLISDPITQRRRRALTGSTEVVPVRPDHDDRHGLPASLTLGCETHEPGATVKSPLTAKATPVAEGTAQPPEATTDETGRVDRTPDVQLPDATFLAWWARAVAPTEGGPHGIGLRRTWLGGALAAEGAPPLEAPARDPHEGEAKRREPDSEALLAALLWTPRAGGADESLAWQRVLFQPLADLYANPARGVVVPVMREAGATSFLEPGPNRERLLLGDGKKAFLAMARERDLVPLHALPGSLSINPALDLQPGGHGASEGHQELTDGETLWTARWTRPEPDGPVLQELAAGRLERAVAGAELQSRALRAACPPGVWASIRPQVALADAWLQEHAESFADTPAERRFATGRPLLELHQLDPAQIEALTDHCGASAELVALLRDHGQHDGPGAVRVTFCSHAVPSKRGENPLDDRMRVQRVDGLRLFTPDMQREVVFLMQLQPEMATLGEVVAKARLAMSGVTPVAEALTRLQTTSWQYGEAFQALLLGRALRALTGADDAPKTLLLTGGDTSLRPQDLPLLTREAHRRTVPLRKAEWGEMTLQEISWEACRSGRTEEVREVADALQRAGQICRACESHYAAQILALLSAALRRSVDVSQERGLALSPAASRQGRCSLSE